MKNNPFCPGARVPGYFILFSIVARVICLSSMRKNKVDIFDI